MANTATLHGRVDLNVTPFRAGMNQVRSIGRNVARQTGANLSEFITKPVKGIAAAAAAYFTYDKFKSGITGAFEAGAALSKMSQKTGVAASSLAALQATFKSADVETDYLNGSLVKMQRNLYSAARGSTSTNSGLRLLGLNIDTLKKMRPEEQFASLGGAINKIKDPMQRTALAMQFFGKTGTELMPVFEVIAGADFSKLKTSSRLLAENADQLDRTDHAMSRAKTAANNFFIAFAAAMAPKAETFAESILHVDWAKLGQQSASLFSKGASIALDQNAWIWQKTAGFVNNLIGNNSIAKPVKDWFNRGADETKKRAEEFKREKEKPVPGDTRERQQALLPSSTGGMGYLQNKVNSGVSFKDELVPRTIDNQITKASSIDKGKRGWSGNLGGVSSGIPDVADKLGSPFLLSGGIASQQARRVGQNSALGARERRRLLSERVAAGQDTREGSTFVDGTPTGAHSAVRNGDAQRRKAFEAQQERGKSGVDKSNDLLEDLVSKLGETNSKLDGK